MPATLLDNTGHRGETAYELNLLAEYLRISEAAIPIAEKAAHERLQESATSLEGEDELFFAVSQLISQAGRYRREFPLRLRYGFLIQLYTLLEDRARTLCKVIADREGLGVPQLRDTTHEGFVIVFKNWITKNTNGTSNRWDFAETLRVIRNCIAHANGRIAGDRNSKRLRETIKDIDGVYEDEFGYVALRAAYCDEAHKQISQLFEDIYQTTKFGSSFFLAHRQPQEIGVIVDQSGESPVFEVLGEDDEHATKK